MDDEVAQEAESNTRDEDVIPADSGCASREESVALSCRNIRRTLMTAKKLTLIQVAIIGMGCILCVAMRNPYVMGAALVICLVFLLRPTLNMLRTANSMWQLLLVEQRLTDSGTYSHQQKHWHGKSLEDYGLDEEDLEPPNG